MSDLHRKQLRDAVVARLVAKGKRHAETKARWKEQQVGWAEAETRLKAEMERLPMRRTDLSSAAASTASAAAVPAYGGDYLEIVKLLEQGRESSAADASRAEVLSKQVEVFWQLKAAMAARLS